jgi:hypothetical protein
MRSEFIRNIRRARQPERGAGPPDIGDTTSDHFTAQTLSMYAGLQAALSRRSDRELDAGSPRLRPGLWTLN